MRPRPIVVLVVGIGLLEHPACRGEGAFRFVEPLPGHHEIEILRQPSVRAGEPLRDVGAALQENHGNAKRLERLRHTVHLAEHHLSAVSRDVPRAVEMGSHRRRDGIEPPRALEPRPQHAEESRVARDAHDVVPIIERERKRAFRRGESREEKRDGSIERAARAKHAGFSCRQEVVAALPVLAS